MTRGQPSYAVEPRSIRCPIPDDEHRFRAFNADTGETMECWALAPLLRTLATHLTYGDRTGPWRITREST